MQREAAGKSWSAGPSAGNSKVSRLGYYTAQSRDPVSLVLLPSSSSSQCSLLRTSSAAPSSGIIAASIENRASSCQLGTRHSGVFDRQYGTPTPS